MLRPLALYYQASCGGGALAAGLRVLETRAPRTAHFADACPHLVNLLRSATHGYRELAAAARRLEGLDEHGHCALRRRWEQQRDSPADSAAQFFVLRAGRWRRGVFSVPPRAWAWLWRAHRLLAGTGKVSFECASPRAFVRRHRLPPPHGDCGSGPSSVPLVHFDVADLHAAALVGGAGPPVEDGHVEALDLDA